MKQAAKLLVINKEGQYLLLKRDNHPHFGYDPDIPGGVVEIGEQLEEALAREAREEIDVIIQADNIQKLGESDKYSPSHNFHLYQIALSDTPDIKLSWEHLSHDWVNREQFMLASSSAQDTYMHFVYDTLNQSIKTQIPHQ